MAGNIPGTSNSALPGVYDLIETQSSGVSVPGGLRVAAIIGEGAKPEVIVASAVGGGSDGLNSTYTSTVKQDGRHFVLSQSPIISNRTQLFRNGFPLFGTEGTIDGYVPNSFDYKIDTKNGHIELQNAHLFDQGGTSVAPVYYVAASTNVGDGYLFNISLVDAEAPSEVWTIKCVSVQRDALGSPIAKTAKFTAFGTVSGNKLDANGNVIFWTANDQTVSNSILSFAIHETSTFLEGDSFRVQVVSGVLNKNDSLTAIYIPVGNINNPVFLQNMTDISGNFGIASTDNNLTLGCQLSFANGAPGIMCLQAAPPLPRRTSFVLSDKVIATSNDAYDFIFALPPGVVPELNTPIHFFVTDPATKVEKQILPNILDFYTLDTIGNPSTNSFIFDDTQAPSGHSFFYTVVKKSASVAEGLDGYITPNPSDATKGIFSSSVVFDSTYAGLTLSIFDATNAANNGSFTIDSVSNGKLNVSGGSGFITESNLRYEVIDLTQTSEYIVINHNVVPNNNALRVTLIDTRDSTFYDAGWLNALASLETVECDIVVPLPKQTISAIFQNSLNHCLTMSNIKNRRERVLFIGAINGLTPDNVTGVKSAAVEDIGVLEGIQGATVADVIAGNTEDLANYSVSAAYGRTFRTVYFYPDQIVVPAGGSNILIDGFYMAAAAAGYLSGNGNIAMPLTNKVLTGFTILRNKQFSPFTLEQLVNAGITVLQPVSGGGNVIWGITTTQSGFVEEQEISIVFIRDRIAKAFRSGFQGFIGMPADDTMIGKLSGRANSMLVTFISQGWITAFKDLLVVQDAVNPTQFNISCRVQPVYPVDFVFIKVSIGIL